MRGLDVLSCLSFSRVIVTILALISQFCNLYFGAMELFVGMYTNRELLHYIVYSSATSFTHQPTHRDHQNATQPVRQPVTPHHTHFHWTNYDAAMIMMMLMIMMRSLLYHLMKYSELSEIKLICLADKTIYSPSLICWATIHISHSNQNNFFSQLTRVHVYYVWLSPSTHKRKI